MAEVAELSVLLKLRDEASRGLRTFSANLDRAGQQAQRAGRQMLLLGAPIVALGGFTIKAGSDFESSFTGVMKTVDATEEQFAELARGMRDMALEIPINVNELNRIGEAAGQLGIQTENILEFTRTMAALGVTTNLSADEAATGLARIANIMNLPQGQFERLGSTIVDLGNNFATTEAEIVTYGLRLAGAGRLVGFTVAQTLGLGTALSSVGIQAEAGGSAMTKALIKIDQQVTTSGPLLDQFASVAGMTASEFSEAWEHNAGMAFTAFVEGLGASGDRAVSILDELEIRDIRAIRSFLGLTGAVGVLRDAMDTGTAAFEANVALVKESELRYETFASKVELFKGQIREVSITIGQELMPVLRDLMEDVRPIIASFGEWAKENAGLIKGILIGAAAFVAVGAVLIPLGMILSALGSIMGIVSAAAVVLGLSMGGLVLLVVGIGAVVFMAIRHWDALSMATAQVWEGMKIMVGRGAAAIGNILEGMVNQFIKSINTLAQVANLLLPEAMEFGQLDEVEFAWADSMTNMADTAERELGRMRAAWARTHSEIAEVSDRTWQSINQSEAEWIQSQAIAAATADGAADVVSPAALADLQTGIMSEIEGLAALLKGLPDITGGADNMVSPEALADLQSGIMFEIDRLTALLDDLPEFGGGGMVPGPLGSPQLAVVHGGEVVSAAGRGGTAIYNFDIHDNTIQGDIDMEEMMLRALADAKQTGGLDLL